MPQDPSDVKAATRKHLAVKKVSASPPKFLGRTTKVRIQKDFPSRDPKFIGRTKNIQRKAVAK